MNKNRPCNQYTTYCVIYLISDYDHKSELSKKKDKESGEKKTIKKKKGGHGKFVGVVDHRGDCMGDDRGVCVKGRESRNWVLKQSAETFESLSKRQRSPGVV